MEVVSMSRLMAGSRVSWASALSMILLGGGCGEPPVATEITPPGVDQRARDLEKKKAKDEPEALGEGAVAAAKAAAGEPKRTKESIPDLEPAPPTAKGETKTTKGGVKYTTLKEGTGAVLRAGRARWCITWAHSTTAESSTIRRKRGTPAEFYIGTGAVIRGWDESVPGMKIGEIRKLDIPAAAGYGALGSAAPRTTERRSSFRDRIGERELNRERRSVVRAVLSDMDERLGLRLEQRAGDIRPITIRWSPTLVSPTTSASR